MKTFRDFISEEVVPTALVKDGSIDLDKEDVRASINMALAKVTADGSITPYIALNRISKALSMFHIILPKRVYLEGAKGVEVHELRQFGNKMGMTDAGEFVNEVPGKFFLFIQYGLNTPMNYGGQYAYPTMGGTFRVMAKVVDQEELNKLLDVAEITMAEEAEVRQMAAKVMAPKEDPHTALGDCDCSQGNSPSTKSAISDMMRKKDKKLSNASLEEEQIEEGQVTGPRSYKGSPDRKRKAVQMALGRKHKDHPDWNPRTNPQYSALKLGRKLQKQGVTEEEQIDELSRKTLGSYVKKASDSRASNQADFGRFEKFKNEKKMGKAYRNVINRRTGIERAADKLAKEETISEKAPPGAKFERMVKHIKKGYSKDGLTKKEKGIAYATAWKAKNKESND